MATLARFLDDLVKDARRQLPGPFPVVFYKPVFAALVECFKQFEFEGEEYERYLAASVASVVAFTRKMLLFVPREAESLFHVPLKQLLPAGAHADLYRGLAEPFRTMRRTFANSRNEDDALNPYDGNMVTYNEHTDDKAINRLHKEFNQNHQDMEDNLKTQWGRETYECDMAFRVSPFYPHRAALDALFMTPVPYLMDDEARFQHTWIVSPTGTGKTTLLENLIMADISKGSVVVLDGENQLIPKIISHLPLERVVLLEPDEFHPLALNLFDSEAIDFQNSTELADFVLGGLMGAELTGLQSGLFRHLARAMTVIPDATIFTLAELLDKNGYEVLRPYAHKLDDYTARFFQGRFNEPSYNPSKQGLWLRLDALLSDPVFAKMFSHPRNRLNLSKEIEAGKVVLISTKTLKAEGREAFGRFMMAMLMQATEKRLNHNPTPSPVYLYVDEAHDYIANEPLIAKMGDKVRKQRLAMTFAHTRMSRITNPDVKDWLSTCRVKFAGRMTNDAAFVAKQLHCEPELLMGLPDEAPYKFAFTQGKQTVVLECPPPIKHGPYSYEEHQKAMRQRYCAPREAPRVRVDPLHVADPIKLPDMMQSKTYQEMSQKLKQLTPRKGEADIDPVKE